MVKSETVTGSLPQLPRIGLTKATEADLETCMSLEKLLNEEHPNAPQQGFLLTSSDGIDQYRAFSSYDEFYVARAEGKVVAFLFALPPESARMQQLIGIQDRFELDRDVDIFQRANLAWLAKVAVEPQFMGMGIASQLYQHFLEQHDDWNILTTTVREPLRNIPSEKLQAKFGFSAIGSLPLGARGAFDDVICSVHLRPAVGNNIIS